MTLLCPYKITLRTARTKLNAAPLDVESMKSRIIDENITESRYSEVGLLNRPIGVNLILFSNVPTGLIRNQPGYSGLISVPHARIRPPGTVFAEND